MQASMESGDENRKKEGESSSARVAAPGAYGPTKRARRMQRDGLQEPVHSLFTFPFESGRFD
jgi:hypothetical protein